MTAPSTPTLDEVRGISIRQPYAACILAGAKTVENRSARWRTGRVLLHTSKTIDRPALHDPLVARTVRDRELVTVAVIGFARIVERHHDPEDTPPCSAWAHPGPGTWCSTTSRSSPCRSRRADSSGPGAPQRTSSTRSSSSCRTCSREPYPLQAAVVEARPDPAPPRPARLA